MKKLIKKLVPKPVIQGVVDFISKKNLAKVPQYSFDFSNLKIAANINLGGVFSDEGIAPLWASDHKDITALFGEDHTFGGINPGDRRALYYLISALKPKTVLEVGTHIGASTLYISCALKQASGAGTVTTVDILDVNKDNAPWKSLGLEMAPRDFAQKLGCLDHIKFKARPSQAYMQETSEKFDFIFLDGDHSSEAVYKEVSLALKLLNPGGLILLHDYYPDAKPLFSNGTIIAGPFRALARVKAENAELVVKPLGALPWPTKLGSHVTSLAVVVKQG